MDRNFDSARRAAAAAIVRVHGGAYVNLLAGAFGGLPQGRRAFAAALFFGCAERLVTLDFLLEPLLKKGVGRLDAEIRAVLETGLYQLLYMRVPHSAAVDESVKLAGAFGKKSAAGLVNAVLRAAAQRYAPRARCGGDVPGGLEFKDETERVCVSYSVSGAVARAVMEALPGEYDDFLRESFASGEVCLRVNTLKTSRGEVQRALEGRGVKTRPGALPHCLYARFAGALTGEPLFASGAVHVQGEASQYACACVAARPGERVLDVCAAPGGKSAVLAQDMGGGEGLTACDIHPGRLRLAGENFSRLGVEGAVLRLGDAAEYSGELCGQDKVLCDVPCSGLGVLAHKPDLRCAGGENFDTLPALQMKILCTASRYVKSGGRLVYSTCTVRARENECVVRDFLARGGGFRLVPPPEMRGLRVRDGMAALYPHISGTDGFFVAVLEKVCYN